MHFKLKTILSGIIEATINKTFTKMLQKINGIEAISSFSKINSPPVSNRFRY